jgi:ribosomal protein S20
MSNTDRIKPTWDPKKGLVAKPATPPTKKNTYKAKPANEVDKSFIENIAKKVYEKVMNEMDELPLRDPSFDAPDDDSLSKQVKVSKGDRALGTAASKLAQLKGELSTILDRAEREGIIRRKDGKTSIINLPKYSQLIGDLPKRIKALQLRVLPSLSLDDEDEIQENVSKNRKPI